MVSRLGMVGRLVLALLAVFVFGVVVASAQAANEPTRAPQWRYEGKILGANETREITAKVPTGGPELELEGIVAKKLKVKCKEGKLAKGAFIANEKEEAVSESTTEFSNCRVEGNGEKCLKIGEPFVTRPIRAEFVLNDEGGSIGSKILVESDPRVGAEVSEIKFEPLAGNEGCKFKNTQLTGLVLALLWTDKTITTEKEIELGENREETSYVLKWPDEPESVYLWSLTNHKFELFKPTELNAFSEKTGLRGALLILTAENGVSNNKKFGLEGLV